MLILYLLFALTLVYVNMSSLRAPLFVIFTSLSFLLFLTTPTHITPQLAALLHLTQWIFIAPLNYYFYYDMYQFFGLYSNPFREHKVTRGLFRCTEHLVQSHLCYLSTTTSLWLAHTPLYFAIVIF